MGSENVYKRQVVAYGTPEDLMLHASSHTALALRDYAAQMGVLHGCLLYTSDAADERSSVDLGGRRMLKKKKQTRHRMERQHTT